ncbi:hypothetical protein Tco_0121757 [Tanacetum coccineum]
MTTLADKSLLSGGDNKPPMLEKHLYDSWKSRMELYMMNRPHVGLQSLGWKVSCLIVPGFQKGDDLQLMRSITLMSFLKLLVVTNRYPTTTIFLLGGGPNTICLLKQQEYTPRASGSNAAEETTELSSVTTAKGRVHSSKQSLLCP